MTEKIIRLKQNKYISAVAAFFYTPWFFVYVGALILVGSLFGLEMPTYYVVVLTFLFAALFCDDTRPVAVLVTSVALDVSRANNPVPEINDSILFDVPSVAAQMIALAAVCVLIFALRICVYKEWKNINLRKTAFLPGILCLILIFFLGGIAAPSSYAQNLPSTLVKSACLLLPYFYFTFTIDWKKADINYFVRFALMISAVLLVQLASVYLTVDYIIVEGTIHRSGLFVGWGQNNTVGGMGAFLMPFLLYAAYTRKNGWIYQLLLYVAFGTVILAMARWSMFIGGVIALFGTVILCNKGKSVKPCRIISLVLLLCALLCAILFWDKIRQVFDQVLDAGFDSNGRNDLVALGWNRFKENLFFGAGFNAWDATLNSIPNTVYGKYHNIIIEFLAVYGVVGLAAFLFHCYSVLVVSKNNFSLNMKFYLGVILNLYLLTMMDIFFFVPTFMIIYSVLLAFTENESRKKGEIKLFGSLNKNTRRSETKK